MPRVEFRENELQTDLPFLATLRGTANAIPYQNINLEL